VPTQREKPGLLDELAAERKMQLEKERAESQQQSDKLAEEIMELTGADSSRIG
jgi:hypothetical protein